MSFNMKELVQAAAEKKGILGVMALCEHCHMPYRKVVKVWKGDKSAKFSHVEQVFKALGCQLKSVKVAT